MAEMIIRLPEDAMAFVAQLVESGEFASTDAVIADALRMLRQKRDAMPEDGEHPGTVHTTGKLRAKFQEAIADPRPYLEVDEVFDEIEAELRAKYHLADAH